MFANGNTSFGAYLSNWLTQAWDGITSQYELVLHSEAEYSATDIEAIRNAGLSSEDIAEDDLQTDETAEYLYDGRGSVVQTTIYTEVELSITYDPFGEITGGVDENFVGYAYNGEESSEVTGLQYLRARYYDTELGSFLTIDSYLGSLDDALSQNRYTYANNDPVNNIDPSGHYSVNVNGANQYYQSTGLNEIRDYMTASALWAGEVSAQNGYNNAVARANNTSFQNYASISGISQSTADSYINKGIAQAGQVSMNYGCSVPTVPNEAVAEFADNVNDARESENAKIEDIKQNKKAQNDAYLAYLEYLNILYAQMELLEKLGNAFSSIESAMNGITENIKNAEIYRISELYNVSIEHAKIIIYSKQWNDIEEFSWTTVDIVYWQTIGGQEFLNEKKLGYISNYSEVIKDAAAKYDIPETLLAGIMYNEFGGDPLWIDSIAYIGRTLSHNGFEWLSSLPLLGDNFATEPNLTSFGNTSIQIRRSLEMLGYEGTDDQLDAVISSSLDPVQNIYMAAKHLEVLKNVDFLGVSANELTDEDIQTIASRYNLGPDVSQEDAKEWSYGKAMYKHMEDIMEALNK